MQEPHRSWERTSDKLHFPGPLVATLGLSPAMQIQHTPQTSFLLVCQVFLNVNQGKHSTYFLGV